MVFTPKIIIYEFRYPMLVQDSTSTIGFHPEETLCGASVIRILCKIILRPNGFHPENNYIRGIGYLCLMQDPPLRVIGFHPKANNSLYGVSAIYVFCKILLRAIGLHPEAKHGYIWK